MTTPNAVAFLLLGIALFFLPGFYPGAFRPDAADGSCTSALWLQAMAPVQAGLGVRFILTNEILPLWHLAMEWHPASVALDWTEDARTATA